MAAASPLVSLLTLLLLLPATNAIYCDEDDCYDLLGLKQDANASEIKKAYYKLSLKHHPDKNPDPESRKLFVKIANAYEILKDESTREQYDYAIAHPEEVFYNTAQYYRAYYGHKTDPRAVLIGLLLIVSAFQYINQLTRYNQAIESVKQTPAYRNRLKALEFERTGGIANKKKGHKQADKKAEEEVSNEVELQIHGVEKPSVWRLYGIQFILLPYSIGKVLTWEICWFWRYRIKKLPYAWEDACYLTQTSLKIPAGTWKNIDEARKEDLVTRRLWEKSNMERYIAETRNRSVGGSKPYNFFFLGRHHVEQRVGRKGSTQTNSKPDFADSGSLGGCDLENATRQGPERRSIGSFVTTITYLYIYD